MPVVTLEVCNMTKEQKAETARVFTEELSRITGLPKVAIIVLFHELPYEDVASGGVLLSDRE